LRKESESTSKAKNTGDSCNKFSIPSSVLQTNITVSPPTLPGQPLSIDDRKRLEQAFNKIKQPMDKFVGDKELATFLNCAINQDDDVFRLYRWCLEDRLDHGLTLKPKTDEIENRSAVKQNLPVLNILPEAPKVFENGTRSNLQAVLTKNKTMLPLPGRLDDSLHAFPDYDPTPALNRRVRDETALASFTTQLCTTTCEPSGKNKENQARHERTCPQTNVAGKATGLMSSRWAS
jgi:hypothetical protein